MRRLRHPVRAIREPFGTAGLIVAMIALVAALGGSALAAKGALTGKQKKEVEKIAKRYAGKPGANGTNGSNGAAGPKGDTGLAGANGTGTNGTNGKSVAVAAIAAGGSKCEGRSGAEVKQEGAASGTAVCEGSPWTAEGTLPEGATETGDWSYKVNSEEEGSAAGATGSNGNVPISFAIPLEAPLGAGAVHLVNRAEQAGTPPSQCQGSAEEPTATAGSLCIYEGFSEVAEISPTEKGSWEMDAVLKPGAGEIEVGTGVAGGILVVTYVGPFNASSSLFGSWAVSAN